MRDLGGRGALDPAAERGDLVVQRREHRAQHGELAADPFGQHFCKAPPGALPPPVRRRRRLPGIDDECAALRLEPVPVPHKLLALPVLGARPLLRLARHADDGQRVPVPVEVTPQPQAQRPRIPRVVLDPRAPLIQRLRSHHQAPRTRRLQFPAQRKPQPARLVHHLHRMPRLQKPPHPRHKLRRRKPPRRPRMPVVALRHPDVKSLVHIQSDLDDRPESATHSSRSPKRDRTLVMFDALFHIAGISPSSPASSHAIYALQRTATAVTLAASAAAFPPTGTGRASLRRG